MTMTILRNTPRVVLIVIVIVAGEVHRGEVDRNLARVAVARAVRAVKAQSHHMVTVEMPAH